MSPDIRFTQAVATSKLASSFAEAAARQPRDAKFSWYVALYLLGHALELQWKAVLIAEGITKDQLGHRGIGHDLRKARKRAEQRLGSDVPTTEGVVQVTEMLADQYKAKALEYVETGSRSFPDPSQALDAVEPYLASLRGWVDRRVRERLAAGEDPEGQSRPRGDKTS